MWLASLFMLLMYTLCTTLQKWRRLALQAETLVFSPKAVYSENGHTSALPSCRVNSIWCRVHKTDGMYGGHGMNPTVVNSGQNAAGVSFSHVLLGIEEGITHFLTVIGGKATIHSFLADGEMIATDLNVPMLKTALQIVDGLVAATGA